MKRLLLSFGYALKGIRAVIKSERNMKIHIAVAALVVVFGFGLKISFLEWLACIICTGLVLSAEIMNTAIETLVDMVSPERKSVAGKIKDMAAGGVFVAALTSIVAGIIVFLPKILLLF